MMMGFRYWLADLISGGELTHRKQMNSMFARWTMRDVFFKEALTRIAAEVKPTSNATVKRMGRIAKDALK